MRPDETARQLAAALPSGGALPEPQLIDPSPAASRPLMAPKGTGQEVSPEEAQKMLDKQQQEAMAADVAAGRAAAAQPRLRERQAAAALRAQLQADGAGSGWADDGAARAVLGDVPGLAPPPQGRYASAARQLAAWVAEQLAVQQVNRRAILKHWFRAQAATLGGAGITDVAAQDMLLVLERALLTTRLDRQWAGFLEVRGGEERTRGLRGVRSYGLSSGMAVAAHRAGVLQRSIAWRGQECPAHMPPSPGQQCGRVPMLSCRLCRRLCRLMCTCRAHVSVCHPPSFQACQCTQRGAPLLPDFRTSH